jgi:hypothetical protein
MIIKLSLVSQILPIHTFLDRSSLKKSSSKIQICFKLNLHLLYSFPISSQQSSSLNCLVSSFLLNVPKLYRLRNVLDILGNKQKIITLFFLEFEQQQKRKTSHKDWKERKKNHHLFLLGCPGVFPQITGVVDAYTVAFSTTPNKNLLYPSWKNWIEKPKSLPRNKS